MSAERIDHGVDGASPSTNGSAPSGTPKRRAPRRASRAPGRDGTGAHARIVMDGREPVFDHATSHVLVDRHPLDGGPIGGPTPGHLSMPSRVRLRLEHVGPWSSGKLALLFGTLVMAAVVAGLVFLYSFLDAAGILAAVQRLVNSSGVGHHFRFDAGWLLIRVIWVAAGMVIVGAVIVFCLTVLYNSLADLTGGLDVTFVERKEPEQRVPEGPTWTARFRGSRAWPDGHDPAVDPAGLPEAAGI